MKTDDSYEEFVQAVSQLNATAKKWKNYKRILTLAKNNSEYLTQEIQKEFFGQFFQCRDESETLRAVHMIEVHGLYSALRKDIHNFRNVLHLESLLILWQVLRPLQYRSGRIVSYSAQWQPQPQLPLSSPQAQPSSLVPQPLHPPQLPEQPPPKPMPAPGSTIGSLPVMSRSAASSALPQ